MNALATVSLGELNDHAELQTRTDRKYIVSTTVLDDFIESLDRGMAVLEIEGKRSFAYESVYFDTPRFDFYCDAAHRRRRRFKVRTRSYLDSDITMLEVKGKGHRQATVKHRSAHPFSQRRHLDAAAERFVDEQLGVKGVAATLRPVLTTRYQRRTFLALEDGARVTIDVGLQCFDECGESVELIDSVIVETKTNGPEAAVDRWLRHRGLRPQKVSKFGTSLGALRPDLPSNKWHRVIDRHFRLVPSSARLVASASATPTPAGVDPT